MLVAALAPGCGNGAAGPAASMETGALEPTDGTTGTSTGGTTGPTSGGVGATSTGPWCDRVGNHLRLPLRPDRPGLRVAYAEGMAPEKYARVGYCTIPG